MKLPPHIETFYRLNEIRIIINSTLDKTKMIIIAKEAIEITERIKTKKEGKERIIDMLKNEIRSYSNSNSEIEIVQFQLASSILMLSLQFLEGTIDDMNAMIIQFANRAA